MEKIEIRGLALSITISGHTRCLVPGNFVSGEWVDTDLSQEDNTIRQAAEAIWTPAAVAAFREQLAADLSISQPAVPDRVSSRQFKLQLLAAGLLDQVESWVASQDQAVQIAYANSGTFLRTEPMMQTGFQALGFTSEQIDAFYTAAAAL